jgi:hypothetical protein
MIKKSVIAMILLMSFTLKLFSCDFPESPEPTTLEKGFTYKSSARPCAVKSDIVEFDIDNVVLDLYYGWYLSAYEPNGGSFELVSVVALFIGDNYRDSVQYDDLEDYRNVDNLYIMNEYSPEEFYSEAFYVKPKSNGWGSRWEFAHHEEIKVPEGVFEGGQASFWFRVCNIWRNKENSRYSIDRTASVQLVCEYIEPNKVKLS